MPTLTHIQYIQLDPMTWCATAQVSEPLSLHHRETYREIGGKSVYLSAFNALNMDFYKLCGANWRYFTLQSHLSVRDIAYNQRQQQRRGVRLLLEALLNKLAITDTLDESGFPYRLIESKYYVCFSHTGASHQNDIDKDSTLVKKEARNNQIAVAISHRHAVGIDIEANKVAWHVAKRFYHRNETAALQALPTSERSALIKLLWQIKESFIKIYQYKLAQGLGKDYSYLMPNLIDSMNEKSPLVVMDDNQSDYRIAVLLLQNTVIIF